MSSERKDLQYFTCIGLTCDPRTCCFGRSGNGHDVESTGCLQNPLLLPSALPSPHVLIHFRKHVRSPLSAADRVRRWPGRVQGHRLKRWTYIVIAVASFFLKYFLWSLVSGEVGARPYSRAGASICVSSLHTACSYGPDQNLLAVLWSSLFCRPPH